jgi:hypothetical protein
LVVAQGGQGILFGVGEAASAAQSTGDVELCLSGAVEVAGRFLMEFGIDRLKLPDDFEVESSPD